LNFRPENDRYFTVFLQGFLRYNSKNTNWDDGGFNDECKFRTDQGKKEAMTLAGTCFCGMTPKR